MKGLLISALLLFAVSSLFRLLHWPFANIMSLLFVFLSFIFALINSFTKKSTFNTTGLGGWVIFSWSLVILFKYLFWYTGPSFFGIHFLFVIASALTIIYYSSSIKRFSKIVLMVSVFGLSFNFTPTYSICYFFSLNEIMNEEHNETNYRSWDQYSWYLYKGGESVRALKANEKAINARKKYEVEYNDFQDSTILILLENHRDGIINETWLDGFVQFQIK